jgi:uncharacterized protein
MRKILLILLFFSEVFCFAQSYTVKTVPNMKLINNSYVSNPDNIVSEGTVAQINQQLAALEQQTTSQVAVVILYSIGEETDFTFAQDLFEEWKIGKANKDNGLLILFIKDQKKIRLHTGLGLEGVLPDAICKRIEIQKMVPHFKEGNVDQGILAGVEEVNKILTDPKYAEEIRDDTSTNSDISEQAAIYFLLGVIWLAVGIIVYFVKRKSGFYHSPQTAHDVPTDKIKVGSWWLWYYILPLTIIFFLAATTDWITGLVTSYGYVGLLGLTKYARITKEANAWFEKKEYHAVHHFLNDLKGGMIARAIFFPIPFLFIWMLFKRKITSVRTTPRDCSNCGKKCVRLDETTEDEYLPKESQFEEELKSVDYDVWKCNACGETSIEAYISEKTEYSECPKCKTHAFYTASSTTKISATTSHAGVREIVKLCKFCNHRKKTTESIPRIETSSSSSSGSSSSSSGSSGGSFGGGSSGGGGASSSW